MSRTAPPGRLASLFAALAIAATAGCASGPLARDRDDREPEIERRLLELEKGATKSRLEIERLRERLATLEVAGSRAVRTSPAPVVPTPAPAPPAAAATPPPADADSSLEIEETDLEDDPGPGAPTRDDEAEEYERALYLLRDGRPEAAESALRAFVAARPQSDLADNAWFWIAESLLVRDQVGEALAAFRSGVERYPAGNKTPDALYKIGHCLELEGDRERAAEVWRELVRRFPQTAAAERASEALRER